MERAGPFDVVVVGGGAAGCVVAARLSETASRSVLVLEAGPDRRRDVPDEMRDGWHLSQAFDWGYTSEPSGQRVAADLRRGKLVGGTSWVTRFALRGSPADYDEWAALGNPGWGFDEVLPYFRRLEADADFGDLEWHGDSGPMPVERYLDVELTDVAAGGLRALEGVGFSAVEDHNRPGVTGAGRMPMNSRDGVRVTTADAYLPAGGTPANLVIGAEAQVDAIVFDGGRAAGVRLLDGTVIEAGWVVLCAGTYGSPSILMRSGVGPADHLRSLGVEVRVDLPGVGMNLADHPSLDVDPGYRGDARRAPVLHAIATFHSSKASAHGPPDLMLWLSDPLGDPPEFSIDVVLLKPRSRGVVRLRSTDPGDPPSVFLPGLHDESDLERMAEGFARAVEVAERPEIRRLCEASSRPAVRDPHDLHELVGAEAYSLPHVVGTCSMGARPQDGAVVGATGNVHGTDGLTVIDASIMPDATSGFPHLPVIMIAERLAEALASVA